MPHSQHTLPGVRSGLTAYSYSKALPFKEYRFSLFLINCITLNQRLQMQGIETTVMHQPSSRLLRRLLSVSGLLVIAVLLYLISDL